MCYLLLTKGYLLRSKIFCGYGSLRVVKKYCKAKKDWPPCLQSSDNYNFTDKNRNFLFTHVLTNFKFCTNIKIHTVIYLHLFNK